MPTTRTAILVSALSATLLNAGSAFAAGAPLKLTPVQMFIDSGPVVKAIQAGLLLTALAALALLVVSLVQPSGSERASRFLKTAVVAAPVAGFFGAAYGLMNSFIGVANSNVTNLAVIAPGMAEAILCLALGMLAMLLCVIASGVAKPNVLGAV